MRAMAASIIRVIFVFISLVVSAVAFLHPTGISYRTIGYQAPIKYHVTKAFDEKIDNQLAQCQRGRLCCSGSVGGEVLTEEDDYSPENTGGCVKDIANHIRLLDQSFQQSSGQGIFDRINDMLWEEVASTANNNNLPAIENITTAEQLDQNKRFGILSHGIQEDPIYNYGNAAALELFDNTIEDLCQTPSRYSTVESLMDDREQLIQSINTFGHGTIRDATRRTTKEKLFVIATIWIWHVFDDNGTRIGLAALYDRAQVTDYTGPPL
ncbi:MEKHLA domain-containing protein [Seminavis robusta]|uniref:MEKHLA domain-containing protein n=1 Tax=Seminavis robusta TaxID=568900 RepID=A0A9N8DV80_9STRA|nr:MEKHLA domain-containing protein [Seminavis robusta]|eukprot:Sro307_g113370.1 MEKHLA domain-containing protein (267) ;mRNA; f:55222-56133